MFPPYTGQSLIGILVGGGGYYNSLLRAASIRGNIPIHRVLVLVQSRENRAFGRHAAWSGLKLGYYGLA